MTSFLLTLPSTSSMQVYPENTQSHFRVQLPHPIDLEGEWLAALSEIQLPRLFSNITEAFNTVVVRQSIPQDNGRDIEVTVTVTPGQSLLTALLDAVPVRTDPLYQIRCVNNEGSMEDVRETHDGCFAEIWVKAGYRLKLPKEVLNAFNWATNSGGYIDFYAKSLDPVPQKTLTSFALPSFKVVARLKSRNQEPKLTVRLEQGYYATPQILLDALRTQILEKIKMDKLVFPDKQVEATFTLLKNQKVHISLSDNLFLEFPVKRPGLGRILGFSDSQIGRVLGPHMTAEYAVDIRAGIYAFYVYSPLIQDQIVGDTRAPLLRAVPLGEDSDTSPTYVKVYNTPDFYPVAVNRFENIEILIYSDYGEPVRFISGKTVVKLKFKKAGT